MKSLGLQVTQHSSCDIVQLSRVPHYIQDVGYDHVNIDDCYAEKNRSSDGFIIAGMLPCQHHGVNLR